MTPRNEREAHSGLLNAAADSEWGRWLDAAERSKPKADHDLSALVLGVCALIGALLAGGAIALLVVSIRGGA